jgi:O-acetyl-ADP-ribose deacetylase (regulator of RNase III)
MSIVKMNDQPLGNPMSFIREIWIVHPEEEACSAYRNRFSTFPQARMIQARLQELAPHDCFVTAANSFGIMNAGVDAAVVEIHGPSLLRTVQDRILNDYLGEQPVGTAFIVDTGNSQYPFVAHAPTMRVPGSIEGTDAVYRATWAALTTIHRHNQTDARPIEVIAFPAMGTGFGGMAYDESARQMAVAWKHYMEPPTGLNWDFVAARQRSIFYNGDRYLGR